MKATWINKIVEATGMMGCLSTVLLFTSCAQQPRTRNSAGSAPVARPSAPVPKVACSESTGGLIKLSKAMPVEATLGLEFVTELTVAASSCAANIVVRDTVPAGVSYVRSEPAAKVEEGQLVWGIGDLDAGQTLKIKLWFK